MSCLLHSEPKACRRATERANVPGVCDARGEAPQPFRHELRRRPVLVHAAVLLSEPCRQRTRERRIGSHDDTAALENDDLRAALDAHRRTRLARQVPGPARLGAAPEMEGAGRPDRPLLHEMRTAVLVRRREPVAGGALEQRVRARPWDHAPRARRLEISRWEPGTIPSRGAGALLTRRRRLLRHPRTRRSRSRAPPT